jgi:hypothetical protein
VALHAAAAIFAGPWVRRQKINTLEISKMNIPLRAVNNHTTEQLLELALAMLDRARREQTGERMPIYDTWLGNNLTLEIIREKVAANKANATINV